MKRDRTSVHTRLAFTPSWTASTFRNCKENAQRRSVNRINAQRKVGATESSSRKKLHASTSVTPFRHLVLLPGRLVREIEWY